MVAAATFFKGQGDGGGLPYLDSYLWCSETGMSYQDWLSLPEPVKECWLLYRNLQAKIQNQQGQG